MPPQRGPENCALLQFNVSFPFRKKNSRNPSFWQIFGTGGAIIQKKNKEKEKGKGKEERREKRKKERGEFNLEDPMFPI